MQHGQHLSRLNDNTVAPLLTTESIQSAPNIQGATSGFPVGTSSVIFMLFLELFKRLCEDLLSRAAVVVDIMACMCLRGDVDANV